MEQQQQTKREHAMTGVIRSRLRALDKAYDKTRKNAEGRYVERRAALAADLPDDVRAELTESGDLPKTSGFTRR